ncbi:MAG: hypothetical protein ACYCPS_00110 [Candidatus Saccharimonadales bacterium]
MDQKTKKRLERHKDREYWFYYHLKKDKVFIKEAAALSSKLNVVRADGAIYEPWTPNDPFLTESVGGEAKSSLMEEFGKRWNIRWGIFVTSYLLYGGSRLIIIDPGTSSIGIVHDRNSESGKMTVRIDIKTVEHDDFDWLWEEIQYNKQKNGINTNSKPRKNSYTCYKSELAYRMWKMLRDGLTWPEVLRTTQTSREFYDITTAKKFLKANGYMP